MNDHLFASAWLKWGQAVVHTQALEADVDAFGADADANPVWVVGAKYNAKRHGFSLKPQVVNFMPGRWSLLLGDIASNYRASLEHLGWALVTRGHTPPATLTSEERNSIYCPIKAHRNDFDGDLQKKLPGVRHADVAKVRRVQPYHYGAKRRARSPLTLLAAINNFDKHRAIEPLWAYPTRVDIEVTDMRDRVLPGLDFKRTGGPIEVGTEIAFIRARKMGPNPEIKVEIDVSPEPCLQDGVAIKSWANICGITLWSLLRTFAPQPPEIADLGANLVPFRG
jgi:hypothetical protein